MIFVVVVQDTGKEFKVLGLKSIKRTKGCYEATLDSDDRDKGHISYSEAVNYLLPKEYKKWQKKRKLLL